MCNIVIIISLNILPQKTSVWKYVGTGFSNISGNNAYAK